MAEVTVNVACADEVVGVLSLLEDSVSRIAREVVEEETRELVRRGAVRQELHVRIGDGAPAVVQGAAHKLLPQCMELAAARRNILMVGPAGCGKSHLAKQIAEGLKLPFGFITCSAGMSEGQLTGRLLPTLDGGRFGYVRSQFVTRYEEGGVFMFDEIDAADSNTLLVINSALANGHMAVENRTEQPVAERHPDFICVAAANTFGTGADRVYVGRSQLDESTLDRFRIGQVEMDYDADLEEKLCPDDFLRSRLQRYRRLAREAKLRRVVSTRFLADAYRMMQLGWAVSQVERALFTGWTDDEVMKVGGSR